MIPDYLYQWFFLILCSIFCWTHNAKLLKYGAEGGISRFGRSTKDISVVLLFFVIIYIGTRPLSAVFVDMSYYAGYYQLRMFDQVDANDKEFIWTQFQKVCYHVFNMPPLVWLFFVTLFSLTLRYMACKKFFEENVLTAFLFIITTFYFWGSITNIIRSDLAFGIVIYGMSSMIKGVSRSKIIIAFFCFFVALFIHKSSMLLIACFLISFFYVKDIKWAIGFWILCIILSLVNHSFFENLFINFGFDDRVESYIAGDVDMGVFSRVGFRWDFLLYSMIPIAQGWIITKKTDDRIYSVLLNTYILANSFWVLVIRAQFSDRFAGISWSLYGLVLAYGLVKVNVWNHQFRKIAYGLTGQVLFLWLMKIYYM